MNKTVWTSCGVWETPSNVFDNNVRTGVGSMRTTQETEFCCCSGRLSKHVVQTTQHTAHRRHCPRQDRLFNWMANIGFIYKVSILRFNSVIVIALWNWPGHTNLNLVGDCDDSSKASHLQHPHYFAWTRELYTKFGGIIFSVPHTIHSIAKFHKSRF